MGEEKANSGEITVNGKKLSTLRNRDIPYLRRTMGIVFQDFRLIDTMTVYENVAFAMHVVGAARKISGNGCPISWGWWGCRIRPSASRQSFPAASASV